MSAARAETGRIDAVDALKGIAILAVLVLHAVPRQSLVDSRAVFHIWQAVPVLIVLMGYTGAHARVSPLRDYARRRLLRLLIPLSIVWLVSLAIAVAKSELVWSPLLLVGQLPAPGPGNYFITLVLEYALILPLLRKLLDKGPWVLVATCFAVNIVFELLAFQLHWDGYLYSSSVLRVLFVAGIGMAVASGIRVWGLLPFSVAYLVAMTRQVSVPFLIPHWQTQSLFAAGYPASLVAMGLRPRYPASLCRIGRASYHIFLVQVLWFGQVVPLLAKRLALPLAASVLVNVAVCVVAGLAFAAAERFILGLMSERSTGGSTAVRLNLTPPEEDEDGNAREAAAAGSTK